MNAHSLDHRVLPAAGEIIPLFAHDHTTETDSPTRIALIGTFAPRKCGIATFTTDVFEQLRNFHSDIGIDVYALDAADSPIEYRLPRRIVIADDPESYAQAAQAINASGVDAVWVQHEFGIFGGPDGDMVCDFVDQIASPLIFTFHTVLTEPSPRQCAIMKHLISRASRIMVMSRQGYDLLVERYGARADIIDVIPHGAPVRPFGRSEVFKQRLGLHGRRVLMTFGLLGPGKGLERVIEAMPAIIARHPETVYRIVGATHPNLIATQGETYREKLQCLARSLGVQDHILWENRFLETEELLDQLEACDIYVTPYVNLQQSTSGTLSYAVALGKAVVSTPYVHARELLAGGVGVLIAPDCHKAPADAICDLLDDEEKLEAMQRRAYEKGHTMVWPEFARASATLIHNAIGPRTGNVPTTALPGLAAVFDMSDATGMLQHAIGIVPDRNQGYCLDDNARALMLMNVAIGLDPEERRARSVVYASFVQHAWNPEKRRFRNFMHFDRNWCEDIGSEDSNGRTLWALGQTIERAPDRDLQRWAQRWFSDVADDLAQMPSPRARAFCMIGAAAALRRLGRHPQAEAILDSGGDLLYRLLDSARRPDWAWFEAVLGYDNPRLPHALIEAGHLRGRPDWTNAGIATLEWITERQTAAGGHFRPVGSETFGKEHAQRPFDQQALEAQAAIEAAQAVYRVTGDARWIEHALTAYGWFFGMNDRRVMLADIASGRCRDGVTPRGVNENCGAESILAFQLAYYSLTTLYTTGSRQPARGTTLERRIQEFDQSASNL